MRVALVALMALTILVPLTSKGDLFTEHKSVPVGTANNTVAHQTYTANQNTTSYSNFIEQEKQEEQHIMMEIQQYKLSHPQYFQQATPCECDSCKTNNVYFYFLENNFTPDDIREAVNLAKSHNLNPIINIEVTRPLSTEEDYINEFRKIESKIPPLNVDMSLEYDPKIVRILEKDNGEGYFKFDALDGFRIGGKIEDFNRLYDIAFGK